MSAHFGSIFRPMPGCHVFHSRQLPTYFQGTRTGNRCPSAALGSSTKARCCPWSACWCARLRATSERLFATWLDTTPKAVKKHVPVSSRINSLDGKGCVTSQEVQERPDRAADGALRIIDRVNGNGLRRDACRRLCRVRGAVPERTAQVLRRAHNPRLGGRRRGATLDVAERSSELPVFARRGRPGAHPSPLHGDDGTARIAASAEGAARGLAGP